MRALIAIAQLVRSRRAMAQMSRALERLSMSMTTLTIRLDPAIAKALAEEAARTNRSRGEVVREALAEHFERYRQSALQALRDLVGCMSGPTGLSVNKRHRAGLGRRKTQ